MDLCQAIYADTRIKHKWPTAIVITAILVLYAGIFYGVGGLLSRGYHYRYWFELSSVLITYAGCMVLSLYWIIRWILFSDSVSKKSEGVRLFRKVILIVMWLCLMAAMVINLIISFIGMDTEKKVYANGLICMSTSDGYSTDEYYNIKVGPFLRRNLTFKETIKFGLINDDDSTGDSGNDAGDSGANDSENSTENNSQSYNDASEIQKMRMQEMRTLTKAWIQKAWPYMITCQLQGYSQPGMPVLFATVPRLKVLLFCFRNRRG